MTSVEIAFSNANLPRRRFATMGSEGLHEAAANMGYDAVEMMPTRALANDIGRRAAKGTFENEVDGCRLLGSLHQTWVGSVGAASLRASLRERSLVPVGSALLMPGRHNSLRVMSRILEVTGLGADAVLYGDYVQDGKPVSFDDKNAPFRQRSVQLHPELYQVQDIRQDAEPGEAESLGVRLKEQGFTSVCLDGFHIRRPSRDGKKHRLDPNRVFQTITAEAIPLTSFHFAIGRIDMPWDVDLQKATKQEKAAAYCGPVNIGRTAIGEMLARSLEIYKAQSFLSGNPFRIVVELPAVGSGAHNWGDYKGIYTDVAQHVKAFADTALGASKKE